jgi:hypothetical protein
MTCGRLEEADHGLPPNVVKYLDIRGCRAGVLARYLLAWHAAGVTCLKQGKSATPPARGHFAGALGLATPRVLSQHGLKP